MESHILMQGLRFYAYHGVGAQETCVGNEFTVDLRIATDLSQAMWTDDLSDTISYADVFEVVKKEMKTPSYLLEHVAGRILQNLFLSFAGIRHIQLRLTKRNPPMGADIEKCGVEISLSRNEWETHKPL